MPVACVVVMFVVVALLSGGWARSQWPYLVAVLGLVALQLVLGISTLRLGLTQPLVTIAHQLLAALLVALLSALLVRRPDNGSTSVPVVLDDSTFEACHG